MREPLVAGVTRAQRMLADAPLPWEAALEHLAETLVPAVADTFVLAVDDGSGYLRQVSAATTEAARTAALSELVQRYPLPIDSPISMAVVHRTGRSRILRGADEDASVTEELTPDMAELLRAVIPAVSALVPLRVRGRSVGVLALGYHDADAIGEGDLPIVEELAYACAVAVDNARLYRMAQEALAESHDLLAQFDTVLAGAPLGIGIYDTDLRYVRCNRALAEIDGTTPEQAIGRTLHEVVPDIAPRVEAVMRRVLASGEPFTDLPVSGTTPAAPDEVRHWDVSYIPVPGEGGPVAVAAIVVEVTDQRRARDALRARVRQQEALAAMSRRALEATDLDVLFERAVASVAEVLGTPVASVFEVLPAGDRLTLRAGSGPLPTGATIPGRDRSHAGYALQRGATVVVEDFTAEDRFQPPVLTPAQPVASGIAVPIRGRVRPYGVLNAHDHHPRRFTDHEIAFLESTAAILQGAIARDEAERQLARSQKLEAVGRLAGGLAHDFNNLLTVVTGNAELIAENPDHPDRDRAITEIRDATGRASQLARQILTFSRGARPPTEYTDLSSTLRELRDLLVPLLRSDVVLDLELVEAEALSVRMAPGQLEQVVVNLAINARDAMPEGGRLLIACDVVDQPDGVDLPPGDATAPYARLRVVDDGCGMNADTRLRALDPFFTTKGDEQGTGLGLSTSWAIVRAAGGDIVIDSEVGRGTTVTVYLPAAWSLVVDPDVVDHAPPAAPAVEPAPRGCVLVVEDQPSIRALVAQTLAAHGYDPVAVADGAAACAVDERPDLLVTDLVMPGMSGDEVVRNLRERWSDLPVLYMSGFTGAMPESPDLPEGSFLAKPFGLRELLDAVADAMGQH